MPARIEFGEIQQDGKLEVLSSVEVPPERPFPLSTRMVAGSEPDRTYAVINQGEITIIQPHADKWALGSRLLPPPVMLTGHEEHRDIPMEIFAGNDHRIFTARIINLQQS